MAGRRELLVGTDEDGNLMSMNTEGKVVRANTELGTTPRALVLKRVADFIAQMTQQTVRHEEAREQVVSRLSSYIEAKDVALWSQAIKELAEADRHIAEGVAQVVASVGTVENDNIDYRAAAKESWEAPLAGGNDILQEKHDSAAAGFVSSIDGSFAESLRKEQI